MIGFFQMSCLVVALLVLPGCYVGLCLRMREDRVYRAPYLPFFFAFGTVGGWFLAFALSPSGLAASCMVFLMTLAPAAAIGSAIWVMRYRTYTRFHRAALYGNLGALGIPVALMLLGAALDR